ncbi:tripartite tricarboxylate transporter TctB family protein [Pseudarthrobacter sulfonivorans]|uniref:tripartite tricarboxylate transporter TctB family protein n=1 Tax=Pseudarthrobacter sulfonivorans TaxID=121292 RepID=UPI00285FD8D2|nr:tripartite tricarboxylate transporter TctB family protein [Pseudarthrobacter sulfonivorans]MDR6415725.1 putative tricarboxylic transport membrane protein [Pseudarthrobacter sulfonivorans]
MSLTQNQPEAVPAVEPQAKAKPGFGTGRSEFVVVAVLYAVAIFLTIGTATMHVQGKSSPGPQFFPIIVCIVLYLVATLLAIQVLRSPKVPDNSIHPGRGQFSADMLHDLGHLGKEEDEVGDDEAAQAPAKTWKTYSDWRTVGMLLAGVVAFVALLEPLGWIISATMLFWIVAYALGSRRRFFDIGVGLLFSSIIQLAFGAGLGLSLPSGLIGGIL